MTVITSGDRKSWCYNHHWWHCVATLVFLCSYVPMSTHKTNMWFIQSGQIIPSNCIVQHLMGNPCVSTLDWLVRIHYLVFAQFGWGFIAVWNGIDFVLLINTSTQISVWFVCVCVCSVWFVCVCVQCDLCVCVCVCVCSVWFVCVCSVWFVTSE